MDVVILRLRYPRGQVPAKGFRCPECGEESLLVSEAEKADEMARDLGLYGIENAGVRKLLRAGNSIAVSLDPELVADVLKGAKPGTSVRVGRVGRRIVVEPV